MRADWAAREGKERPGKGKGPQGKMERGPREFWAGWAEGLGLGLISLFYFLFSLFQTLLKTN